MKKDKVSIHEVGCIYQIDPQYLWGGKFIVATEVHTWGIMGYLLIEEPDNGALIRCNGLAWVRKNWDEIVRVGKSEWIIQGVSSDE